MDAKLVESLRTFGLTEYEAKAYAALVSAGTASVTEVSQLCDVPRSNLYAILENLNEKGYADIQRGRPILFKAIDPKIVLEDAARKKSEMIKEAKQKAIKGLQEMAKEKSAEVVPALIWGIKGIRAVENKINEIISKTHHEVIINTPDVGIFDDSTINEIKRAKKRGVKVKIATQQDSDITKLKRYATIRTRDKIHGFDIVADDKEVLVAPPFPVVAAWVDNPEMALHVKDFLTVVWKDSKMTR